MFFLLDKRPHLPDHVWGGRVLSFTWYTKMATTSTPQILLLLKMLGESSHPLSLCCSSSSFALLPLIRRVLRSGRVLPRPTFHLLFNLKFKLTAVPSFPINTPSHIRLLHFTQLPFSLRRFELSEHDIVFSGHYLRFQPSQLLPHLPRYDLHPFSSDFAELISRSKHMSFRLPPCSSRSSNMHMYIYLHLLVFDPFDPL